MMELSKWSSHYLTHTHKGQLGVCTIIAPSSWHGTALQSFRIYRTLSLLKSDLPVKECVIQRKKDFLKVSIKNHPFHGYFQCSYGAIEMLATAGFRLFALIMYIFS